MILSDTRPLGRRDGLVLRYVWIWRKSLQDIDEVVYLGKLVMTLGDWRKWWGIISLPLCIHSYLTLYSFRT
jgi:hypothetical protein